LLFIDAVTLFSDRVLLVPPETVDHVLPLFVETSHRKDGAGVPLADTEKDVFCPAVTVRLDGCAVIEGAVLVCGVTKRMFKLLRLFGRVVWYVRMLSILLNLSGVM
jgi:hypothetical protein